MTLNPYARFMDERTPSEIIAATVQAITTPLTSLSDPQCHLRPRPDKWSIAEIICHMADTEIVFAFRLRQAISEAHHSCQTFDQDNWAKVYSALNYREALEVFTVVRRWNIHFIKSLSSEVYGKPFTHPERGTMTFGTLIETMAGHDLNHLKQIEDLSASEAAKDKAHTDDKVTRNERAGTENLQNRSQLAAKLSIREMKIGDDATAFRTLNEEWITHFFSMEEEDRKILGDPENTILRKGGHIFMVLCEWEIVACVALVPIGEGVYELSKMAVTPKLRGFGIGRQLLLHTIAEARTIGAKSLFLGSSTKLGNAVHIYESVGFRHVPQEKLPPLPYTRADVFMEMQL